MSDGHDTTRHTSDEQGHVSWTFGSEQPGSETNYCRDDYEDERTVENRHESGLDQAEHQQRQIVPKRALDSSLLFCVQFHTTHHTHPAIVPTNIE
jgi:hypothetical protein